MRETNYKSSLNCSRPLLKFSSGKACMQLFHLVITKDSECCLCVKFCFCHQANKQ